MAQALLKYVIWEKLQSCFRIGETMTLISITDDLYDIAWRLKAINDDYRLVYNTVKNRYEVYSRSTDAIQFVVPYNELDARTVNYALMSRVQNADAI